MQIAWHYAVLHRGMNMKSVDMLAFGVALTLGLAVAQTPREMAIALGVASASLLAKLLMTGPASNAPPR